MRQELERGLLESLLQALSTPLVVIDGSLRIVLANSAAREWWGGGALRLQDAPLEAVFGHDEALAACILRTQQQQVSVMLDDHLLQSGEAPGRRVRVRSDPLQPWQPSGTRPAAAAAPQSTAGLSAAHTAPAAERPPGQAAARGIPAPAAAEEQPGRPAAHGIPAPAAAEEQPGRPAAHGIPSPAAAEEQPGRPAASGIPAPAAAEEQPGQPAAHGAAAPGPLWAVLLFWDETRYAQLEAHRLEAERLDSQWLMIRRLAHELRNPLSGARGAAQLLHRELPQARPHTHMLLGELERLERLLATLQPYGSQPPLAYAAVNVHALLETILHFERHASPGLRFVRDYDPSLPQLQADGDRLHQVLLNLLRNAVEASPPGGEIRLQTRLQRGWAGAARTGRRWFCVRISDQGRGVPDAQRASLFTPLFTTKPHGLGLGLAISRQLVHAHGGMLRLGTPADGFGAVFEMLLPIACP